MGMISLVYVSSASHDMHDDELKAILEVSRRNNEKRDVTGMLLYRDGFFIQALEGEEDIVMEVFEKIKHDDRHKNVILVYRNPVPQRMFGSWKMGFNKLRDTEEKIEGYTTWLRKPTAEFLTEEPSRARLLLESFREHTFF